jgi:hypothetical protein
MKKILVLVLTLVMIFTAAGCSSSKDQESRVGPGEKGEAKVTVGIVQIVEHPSLNTIREACVEQLAAKGFKEGDNLVIDYQNAQNDQTNLKTICQKFAVNNYDLSLRLLLLQPRRQQEKRKRSPSFSLRAQILWDPDWLLTWIILEEISPELLMRFLPKKLWNWQNESHRILKPLGLYTLPAKPIP